MKADLADLHAFLAVAQARGFRDAARSIGSSASTLSEAVRRLEARLGVRLLHRSTRSVTPTEAGTRLIERLAPALGEVEAALDVVNLFRDRPAGTLRLNVLVSAARLVLPPILPGFLAAHRSKRAERSCKTEASRPARLCRWRSTDIKPVDSHYGCGTRGQSPTCSPIWGSPSWRRDLPRKPCGFSNGAERWTSSYRPPHAGNDGN